MDFFGGLVLVVTTEAPGVGLGEVFQGTDVGFLDGGGSLEISKLFEGVEDFIQKSVGGGAVAGEGEVDAIEPGAEAIAKAGHGGRVGLFVEGFVDDVSVEAFEYRVVEGGLGLWLEDVEGEGDLGALELGILGIVKGEA